MHHASTHPGPSPTLARRVRQEAGVAGSSATYATLCDVFAKQGKWDKLRTAVQVKGGFTSRCSLSEGGQAGWQRQGCVHCLRHSLRPGEGTQSVQSAVHPG